MIGEGHGEGQAIGTARRTGGSGGFQSVAGKRCLRALQQARHLDGTGVQGHLLRQFHADAQAGLGGIVGIAGCFQGQGVVDQLAHSDRGPIGRQGQVAAGLLLGAGGTAHGHPGAVFIFGEHRTGHEEVIFSHFDQVIAQRKPCGNRPLFICGSAFRVRRIQLNPAVVPDRLQKRRTCAAVHGKEAVRNGLLSTVGVDVGRILGQNVACHLLCPDVHWVRRFTLSQIDPNDFVECRLHVRVQPCNDERCTGIRSQCPHRGGQTAQNQHEGDHHGAPSANIGFSHKRSSLLIFSDSLHRNNHITRRKPCQYAFSTHFAKFVRQGKLRS